MSLPEEWRNKVSKEELLVKAMKEHMKSMSKRERLAYLIRLLWGSKYGWGEEHIGSTDCSGSISFALVLMGYNIRTTADGFRNLFSNPISADIPGAGDLALWWKEDKSRIKHVAVFSGRMLIMNAQQAFADVPIGDQIMHRPRQAFEMRRLDWKKLREASDEGGHAYGVDDELLELFSVFEMEGEE